MRGNPEAQPRHRKADITASDMLPVPRLRQAGLQRARRLAGRGARALWQRRCVADQAARVDDHKLNRAPIRSPVQAVARDARVVVHDGRVGAGQAVEQRALAHVWAADDGHLRQQQARSGLVLRTCV